MGFELLDPERDREKWFAVIGKLPPDRRDVHWWPDYLAAERMRGNEPRLAVYSHKDNVVCQPIVVRHVFPDRHEDLAPELWTCRDVSSPYGYGGPVASDPHLYGLFSEAFGKWAVENRVVTEFCALHPFMLHHQVNMLKAAPSIKVRDRKGVVWMDLSGQFWREDYHDNRRQGVERARKAGIAVRLAADPAKFIELYRATMLRKQAAARWYFPDEYLRAACAAGLVFHAELDGFVHSAALVLAAAGQTAYYHLAGNAFENPRMGANDLLLDGIAEAMARQGCKRLHLGGGATSDPRDPVLFFKSGFSDLRAPAKSYFRVFDEQAYALLCTEKKRREVAETGTEFETSFEPMYRREPA